MIAVCFTAEDVEGNAITGDCVFDGTGQFDRFGAKAEGGLGDFVEVGFAIRFEVWKFP